MANIRNQIISVTLRISQTIHTTLGDSQTNAIPLESASPNYFVPYHTHTINNVSGLREYLARFISTDDAYDILAELIRELPDPTLAVNIGSGIGLFKIKDGYNLQFKSLKAASASVSITQDIDGNVLIDAIAGNTDGGTY
jgi:hypothetical protein